MNRHRLAPAVLIAVCLSTPVLAQVNPFRGSSGTPLNADDIAALNDATNRLLTRADISTGISETWTNPKSGATGTATAGSAVRRKGLACRVVKYERTVPPPIADRTLTWCKTKAGWKIG